ncbi:MAG: error-prone DNA polymerase [Polyangiaceae bacterium]|nr:error-prone DNA polymerase [Polyangiaceae bacterium]
MGSRYVELTARTNFSFLAGASSPESMVERAARIGYDAIAITDRDGLYGIVRAHEAAEKHGIRIILGCELTLENEGDHDEVPGKATTLTVLVENHAGYTNLCEILTESHARHPESPFTGIPLSRVCAKAAGLWALADATLPIGDLKRAFGHRLSIAVYLHKDGEDRVRVTRTLEAQRNYGVAVCAVGRVLFARPEDKPVFDVLHCIREGKTLGDAGRDLLPNAEAHLKSEEQIERLFSVHPAWIGRSRFIADRCLFSIKELSYRFPYELTDLVHRDFRGGSPAETADEALRRLTYDGAGQRYSHRRGYQGVPASVALQIEKELALITKLEVAPYFLSVRAIVDMARRRDILCQGRGSAANSAVCYCLGITAVDPARSNLLFERFLSNERREPPDIDVDFEHERREEIIQEIYEVYGRDRAAMVSEVISYRSKSALRDVGKTFGLSLEQVGALSSVVTWWDGMSAVSESRLKAMGLSSEDPRVRQTLAFAHKIQGFPRHLSIHVGGFVLSAAPLSAVAPIEPATMAGRTIIPWDKDDIDTLGFFKIDVLGLGMLTAIRRCLDLVKDVAARGPVTDRLAAIPAEDPSVYDALCKADSVGVFQIESRAQMAMLPRLRPQKFYDLVIEVAIVRPGPIQGGMVHPYLRRRAGEEKAEPPHPLLAPILERTLGVPLFQEQVMQIAIVGAGYGGREADRLRRDMAAWRKTGNLEIHRERLLSGFRERGIPEAFGERLYQQIQGFAEYGFPESHAASFALLVYASAWLKVHHPAAFAAAIINSQPMGFYSPSTLLQDAKRHGVRLLPFDVNASGWDCACPSKMEIRLGLRLVRGLSEEVCQRIESVRKDHLFTSIEDLTTRARLDKKALFVLAESGALDDLSGGRREAIWKVARPRMGGMWSHVESIEPCASFAPMSRAEQLVLDYERTGISVTDHPMKLVRPRLSKRIKSSRDCLSLREGMRVSVAGLVICRQRPGTASGVVFVTMEDEFGFLNLVLWSRVFEKYRHVAMTARLLMVHGKIERSDKGNPSLPKLVDRAVPSSVIYVVAERVESLDMHLPDMVATSRDFH